MILTMFLLSPSGSVVKLWQSNSGNMSDAVNANHGESNVFRDTCVWISIDAVDRAISLCFLYDVYVSIKFMCLLSDHNALFTEPKPASF